MCSTTGGRLLMGCSSGRGVSGIVSTLGVGS